LQWFLMNWRIWLIVLIVAGLAADWIMWLVRWRPHRLLISRFQRKTKDEAVATVAAWDDGTGYYSPELPQMEDTDAWDNLSPLSEISPDWADNLALGGMGDPAAYAYEEEEEAPATFEEYDENAYYTEAYEEPVVPAEAPAYYEPEYDEPDGDTAVYTPPPEPETEQAIQYGRPAWPGAFQFQAQQYEEPEPEPEPEPPTPIYEQTFYDYIREDDQPPERFVHPPSAHEDSSRRRRTLRGNPEDIRAYEASFARPPDPPPSADNRPARLVRPDTGYQKADDELRTVTGKPVKRRGLFSDADDEPIAGLPPLRREDPFMSEAEPE